MLRFQFKSAWLATTAYCVGVLTIALLLEISVFSLAIAAALCLGLLFYGVSACASRIEAAKLLLLNSALLAVIFVLLRVTLAKFAWRISPDFWPWLHRIYRVWWISEYSAIILALIVVGLLAIEVAERIGREALRKRFQRCLIAAASILVVINIANLLRPVWCADCFFPYGLPFTFFTQGGFAGGEGFVWLGLAGDAALVLAVATLCAVLWNRFAQLLSRQSL